MSEQNAEYVRLPKIWVCQVVRSGYHNGDKCWVREPHENWGCGYRYEFSVPVPDDGTTFEVRAVPAHIDCSGGEK